MLTGSVLFFRAASETDRCTFRELPTVAPLHGYAKCVYAVFAPGIPISAFGNAPETNLQLGKLTSEESTVVVTCQSSPKRSCTQRQRNADFRLFIFGSTGTFLAHSPPTKEVERGDTLALTRCPWEVAAFNIFVFSQPSVSPDKDLTA